MIFKWVVDYILPRYHLSRRYEALLNFLSGKLPENVLQVRSLLMFKDIDMAKYLEQLKLSRDFRMLLTDVKFDQSTAITVTQKVATGLQSYFTATASFDKDIGMYLPSPEAGL